MQRRVGRPRTTRARLGLGLVGAFLGAGLLTACGGGGVVSTGSLTLYSGQHVQTTQALVRLSSGIPGSWSTSASTMRRSWPIRW